MKSHLLILTAYLLLTILFSSCEKEATVTPLVSNTSLNGLGTGGNNGGTSPGTSATYQPLTAGSYWKYAFTFPGKAADTSVLTFNNKTSIINGKKYYHANQTSKSFGEQTGYIYNDKHIYTQRAKTFIYGITLELLYLNDTTAAGRTWTTPVTDDGLVNGVPARIVGKVVEKNISRTVYSKKFNDVIHTALDYQYNTGNGFETYITYEFYVAKGVGIIETGSNINGTITSTSKLFDYSIK